MNIDEASQHLSHTFAPVFDENSRVLILGSFPSVKSREALFYYGHPQNRFWRVLATILKCDIPITIDEKKQMLIANQIALWDVIESCDIIGSSDSSIKNVTVNNISNLLQNSGICRIYANGAAAKKLYEKYIRPVTRLEITGLPSTSPANAAYSVKRLVSQWTRIKRYI